MSGVTSRFLNRVKGAVLSPRVARLSFQLKQAAFLSLSASLSPRILALWHRGTRTDGRQGRPVEMACVTLKRPIDVLGNPHLAEIQPLAKRKRCGPPLFSATPSPGRGVKRAKRRLEVDEAYSPNSGPASPVPSPFLGAVSPVEPGNWPTTSQSIQREGERGDCVCTQKAF